MRLEEIKNEIEIEEYIKNNKDKVNWKRISQYQKLSEVFIEKHKDEINWDLISQYQKDLLKNM